MYIKIIIALLLATSVGVTIYTTYDHIYARGYTAAENKYQEERQKYIELLEGKIVKLENNSSNLANQLDIFNQHSDTQYMNILREIRNKPLYVVNKVTGECSPSEDFIKAYNDGITETNKK